jgi:hypothetical protein
MHVSFSSVAWEDVFFPLTNALAAITNRLSSAVGTNDYGVGVDQLIIVAIVFSNEYPTSPAVYPQFNRCGSYTETLTSRRVKYLSVSFPVDHDWLVAADENQIDSGISWAIADRMSRDIPRTPKAFRLDVLLNDVTSVLAASS